MDIGISSIIVASITGISSIITAIIWDTFLGKEMRKLKDFKKNSLRSMVVFTT